VWKDVDGILTADPRSCPAAKPVPFVTFEEAQELAYFGAQVIYCFVCILDYAPHCLLLTVFCLSFYSFVLCVFCVCVFFLANIILRHPQPPTLH
jgi:hypothetical protein